VSLNINNVHPPDSKSACILAYIIVDCLAHSGFTVTSCNPDQQQHWVGMLHCFSLFRTARLQVSRDIPCLPFLSRARDRLVLAKLADLRKHCPKISILFSDFSFSPYTAYLSHLECLSLRVLEKSTRYSKRNPKPDL